MSTLIDVARRHWGFSTAVADDAEVSGRLHVDVIRYKAWGDNADSIFRGKPELFAAHEAGDVEKFARLLGVQWPLPEVVTLKSLSAELDALAAKVRAFAGV